MTDIIIVGAGWAGCAAAVAAAKQGARVKLLERTDMILGTGLAGGILRNNGRLTAALELEAMGLSGEYRVAEAENTASPETGEVCTLILRERI